MDLERPSLTVLSGAMAGTVFVVDDSMESVLIGSDPSCRFALSDSTVSPIHARLWIDLEGIVVYDSNSPGGVYINDGRLQGQGRLRSGDILCLGAPAAPGSVMLQCRLPATAAAAGSSLPPDGLKLLAPDAIQPEPPVLFAPGDYEAPTPRVEASAPVTPTRPRMGPIPIASSQQGNGIRLIIAGLVAVAAAVAGGWWFLARNPAAVEISPQAARPTPVDPRPAAAPAAVAEPEQTPPASVAPVEEEVVVVPPEPADASSPPAPAPAATPASR